MLCDGAAASAIRDLRIHVDAFCNAHADGRFFCSAGGYTYRLNLLGTDLSKPGKVRTSVEQSRREMLPLATLMADQCLATMGCKELALIYFSDAATILRKPQLTASEGAALSKDAVEMETALNGEQR